MPPVSVPRRILLTEATSLSARQTLYALGSDELGPGNQPIVDVMDPAPLSQCRFSTKVRRWLRCPHYARDPEAFLKFLVRQIADGGYDVLLPTHEQVFLISRFADSLAKHVGIALPSFDAMQTMQNKADFTRTLSRLDIPHPTTRFVRTVDELRLHSDYPCYVKLSHSTAGCGVFRVESLSEMESLVTDLHDRGLISSRNDTLIQQPAAGIQSTVQAVFDRGRIVRAHMFEARAIGVGGMSPARVAAHHPVVYDHVARLGESIQWHGGIFIDYFYDHTNDRPEYIEANPRIGETVNAWLVGKNLPEALLEVSEKTHRVAIGKDLERTDSIRHPDSGSEPDAIRTHSFYMILISKAHDGASRWTLWKELFAWLFGLGLYADSQDELTRPRDDWMSILPLIWICMQLLTWPRLARKLVQSTIDNYSLPESAVDRVCALPDDLVERLFERHQVDQPVQP
ncbi:MAG: hypothetical protein AAGD07_03685 [Planctomycetota bacterium]